MIGETAPYPLPCLGQLAMALGGGLVLKSPLWLLAAAALPGVVWLRGRRRVSVLLVPFAAEWHRPSLTAASRWPAAMVLAGLGFLIAALARPQQVEEKRDLRSEGYDIMLCLDLSGSMTWEDHDQPGTGPNRIDTIKPIVQAFIRNRPYDRIGMVVFGRRAYTLSPPTFDHDWILRQYSRLKIGIVDPDGTTIGDGLGMALNRLEQERDHLEERNRGAFIVLLTDGGESMVDSPAGPRPLSILPPLEAAQIAKAREIPVYCIGVGKEGFIWAPYYDGDKIVTYTRQVSDLDPDLLREIARLTHGGYFRAEERDTLESAFKAIDQNKKIDLKARHTVVTTELFPWLAAPGLALLFAGGALALSTPQAP
jgi:Ca-activated chloride channel homolog